MTIIGEVTLRLAEMALMDDKRMIRDDDQDQRCGS